MIPLQDYYLNQQNVILATRLIEMYNHLKHIKLIFVLTAVISSCAVIYNIPDISDYKIFPCRVIKNSPESIFYFPKAKISPDLGKVILVNNNSLLPNVVKLDDYIKGSKVAAFIIIRNDTILYEIYHEKFECNTIFNTFSVTKIFITTLVGIAIDEGLIKNVDEAITNYIPELIEIEGFSKITIRHLLNHTSGIKFSDSKFNPFSDNARYYYGHDLRKLLLKTELYGPPGKETHYSSV